MRSAVARRTGGRKALVAFFEAGHFAAMARVLAGFRLEGHSGGRGLGKVDGVPWEQANAASAVAGSSRRSVWRHQDAALLAGLFDNRRRSHRRQERGGAVRYIGKATVARIRPWLVAGASAGIEGRLYPHTLRAGGASSMASVLQFLTPDRWQSPLVAARDARGTSPHTARWRCSATAYRRAAGETCRTRPRPVEKLTYKAA